jgi:hypothetical protein
MLTTVLCVICALIGAALAAVWSRGKHPLAVFVGLVVGALFGLAPFAFTQGMLKGLADIPGPFARVALYLHGMQAGDPVMWTATILFLLFALVLLAVWAWTAREFEQEEKRRHRLYRD